MSRRSWGIGLVLVGLLVAAGSVAAVFEARQPWQRTQASCADSGDDWCGGARTYLAALGLALAPLATVAGMLAFAIGATMLAFPKRERSALTSVR